MCWTRPDIYLASYMGGLCLIFTMQYPSLVVRFENIDILIVRPRSFNLLVIDYSDLQESRGEALKIKKIKRNFKITLKLSKIAGCLPD